MMTDLEIIERVNEVARQLLLAEGITVAQGTRCDFSRNPVVLAKWHAAVEICKADDGIDGQEALVRHEAKIRHDAAVLHVDRR